jgi:23S rRNA (guanosine2251-2'-O)-methyltransferase
MSGRAHGRNAVLEMLRKGERRVLRLVIATGREDERIAEIIALARRAGVPVHRRPIREVDGLAGPGAVHQGVVAEITPREYDDPRAILASAGRSPLYVVLDGVEDPRNLGAVIRSAAAAGADALFLPGRRAAGLTPGALKTASGAAEHLPMARIGNVVSFLNDLKKKEIWVAGLDAAGTTAWCDFDLSGPLALVVGAEGKGLRRLARETCDVLLSIPLARGIESLNLSVAAGVVLFEAVRQRRAKQGRFCE